jgi:hypothetical protein
MKKAYFLLGLLLITQISCTNDDDSSLVFPSTLENLIAYYPFNGNAVNEVNTENIGTVEGATLTSDINTLDNKAYFFDGVDDVITINHDDIFNFSDQFTISALVKADEIKTQTIIRKGSQVNGADISPFSISFSQTGDIVFTMATMNGEETSSAIVPDYQANTWYLITGVFKNSELLLYVNGELKASEMLAGAVNVTNEPVLIGTRLRLPSSTFKGIIDEIRMYDIALSESEIRALYDNL